MIVCQFKPENETEEMRLRATHWALVSSTRLGFAWFTDFVQKNWVPRLELSRIICLPSQAAPCVGSSEFRPDVRGPRAFRGSVVRP